MAAGYWFIQRHIGDKAEAEQRCTDCAEVVAEVKAFMAANRDPGTKLRVRVPSHASHAERSLIEELGVEAV